MAKNKQVKQEAVQTISENFSKSKSVVFANFQGLKMTEIDELRAKCKEQGIKCMASKKTLIKKAAEQAGLNIDTKPFEGGVAVFFGFDDEVGPAKIIAEFAKKHEAAKIFGGVLGNLVIEASKVESLSKLPSKLELYAQFVRTLNGPMTGMVNVMTGNVRALLNALNAIKESKV